MTDRTELIAETTERWSASDALSEPLRAMRVRSGLLLRERYGAPWAVRILSGVGLTDALSLPTGSRVAAFHLVESGELHIDHPGAGSFKLAAGQMAICFDGGQHTLSSGDDCEAIAVEKLLVDGPRIQRNESASQASGRGTSLLCGIFQIADSAFNPLLSALPPLLTCSLSRPGELDCLGAVSRIMASEIDRAGPGGAYVVERLLEVLCAEAIRSYVERAPLDVPSFFVGLRDPLARQVLAAIHERPGRPWSVKLLAQQVAMSPSRMAARFSAAMGVSVMAYLSQWRMHLACGMLMEGGRDLQETALELGYESSPAFQRAFKRVVGVAPGIWREQSRS